MTGKNVSIEVDRIEGYGVAHKQSFNNVAGLTIKVEGKVVYKEKGNQNAKRKNANQSC